MAREQESPERGQSGRGGPVGKDDKDSPFADSIVDTGPPPPPSDRNADGQSNPNIKPPPADGSDKMTE
jgi:hypothetical protein